MMSRLLLYDRKGALIYDGPTPWKCQRSALRFLIEWNEYGSA
jgi:hypothetical protein